MLPIQRILHPTDFSDLAEEALAYAAKHGLRAEVEEPRNRRVRPKSYADNFRWQPPG